MPPRRLPQVDANKCADPFAGAESLQVFGGRRRARPDVAGATFAPPWFKHDRKHNRWEDDGIPEEGI